MRLKTLLPTSVATDVEVSRLRIEAENGSMTFLPDHADFVTAVAPGVVSFNPTEGEDKGRELFMACDRGILVKEGENIFLSVRRAVINDDLNVLTRMIGEEFKKVEEERKTANTALTRLEVNLTRGLLKLSQGGF